MKEKDDIQLKISEALKLNWTDFAIQLSKPMSEPTQIYQITSDKYLKYAKEDYRNNDEKSLINSLGNAKRAIDSHIDVLINGIGLSENHFTRESNVSKFIREFYNYGENDGVTNQIKLLQILEISPSFLISKIRKIRNEMEHDYISPRKSDVKEAIEVAELFINASMRKMSFISTVAEISSDYKYDIVNKTELLGIDGRCLKVHFEEEKKIVKLDFYNFYRSWIFTADFSGDTLIYKENCPENKLSCSMILENDSYEFLIFLKILVTQDFIALKNYLESQTPDEKITFIVDYL